MPAEPDPAAPPGRKPIAASFATAVVLATWLGSLFAAAGTIRWPTGWFYVAVVGVGLVSHRAHVARSSPALVARRASVGIGTPRWDMAWVAVFWPLMLATPIVAGVETQRLGRPELPPWSAAAGALLFVAGMILSARAMVANPFFEGTARLQPDQRVVDTGPYARVRHPGYAALMLWSLSTPLLLRLPDRPRPGARLRGLGRGPHHARGPDAPRRPGRLRSLRTPGPLAARTPRLVMAPPSRRVFVRSRMLSSFDVSHLSRRQDAGRDTLPHRRRLSVVPVAAASPVALGASVSLDRFY